MKRTLVLVFSLFLGLSSSQAQKQFAVLIHDNDTSVFYGISSFRDAHNAAVDGDIINLSPGSFYASDITKLITINGSGAEMDTINGIYPTIVFGYGTRTYRRPGGTYLDNMAIHPNHTDSIYRVQINGIRFNDYFAIYGPNEDYISFFRCYINSMDIHADYSGSINNTQFVNCIIRNFGLNGCAIASTGTTFVNCYVSNFSVAKDCFMYNSIVQNMSNCNNCGWVYYTESLHTQNSILINDTGSVFFSGLNMESAGSTIGRGIQYDSITQVFENFNSGADSFNFQLKNSIIQQYGNNIGVYGGIAPFSMRYAKYKTSIAGQSSRDGKLEVTITPIDD